MLRLVLPELSHREAPPGTLPYIDFWLLEETIWIGLLTLRPRITAELMRTGGLIGCVIRPSRRRQGYGTALLRLGLEQARNLGLTRVLLTCADTNSAGFIPAHKIRRYRCDQP